MRSGRSSTSTLLACPGSGLSFWAFLTAWIRRALKLSNFKERIKSSLNLKADSSVPPHRESRGAGQQVKQVSSGNSSLANKALNPFNSRECHSVT